MTKIEAINAALDALELMIYDEMGERNKEAICVLRAELAKPEPEPVAWLMENADYPKIGRNLTFTPHDRWHPSWTAIPLYRKE
jgi:hypothetical protein